MCSGRSQVFGLRPSPARLQLQRSLSRSTSCTSSTRFRPGEALAPSPLSGCWEWPTHVKSPRGWKQMDIRTRAVCNTLNIYTSITCSSGAHYYLDELDKSQSCLVHVYADRPVSYFSVGKCWAQMRTQSKSLFMVFILKPVPGRTAGESQEHGCHFGVGSGSQSGLPGGGRGQLAGPQSVRWKVVLVTDEARRSGSGRRTESHNTKNLARSGVRLGVK